MSTDYQVLLQKFENFKKFVIEITPDKKIVKEYENMTNNEFLLFGSGFLVPNKDKIDQIVSQLCNKVKVTQPEHRVKLQRYLECFIEYLEQLDNTQVFQDSIVGCVSEGKLLPKSS